MCTEHIVAVGYSSVRLEGKRRNHEAKNSCTEPGDSLAVSTLSSSPAPPSQKLWGCGPTTCPSARLLEDSHTDPRLKTPRPKKSARWLGTELGRKINLPMFKHQGNKSTYSTSNNDKIHVANFHVPVLGGGGKPPRPGVSSARTDPHVMLSPKYNHQTF